MELILQQEHTVYKCKKKTVDQANLLPASLSAKPLLSLVFDWEQKNELETKISLMVVDMTFKNKLSFNILIT